MFASSNRLRDIRILQEVLLFIPVGWRCKFLFNTGLTLHFNPDPYGKSGHNSERYGDEYKFRENILLTKFFKFFLYT